MYYHTVFQIFELSNIEVFCLILWLGVDELSLPQMKEKEIKIQSSKYVMSTNQEN